MPTLEELRMRPEARVSNPVIVLLGTLIVALMMGCSKPSTQPIVPTSRQIDPPVYGKGLIDNSPTWSHDGQWIAYHRVLGSRDGPAGVYTIRPTGGRPRLIVAGDFDGPRMLRFSPDDRRLVGVWATQLVIIDVATGSVSRPIYTAEGAITPDWSPNGRDIVYRRAAEPIGGPLDSAGFHIFNIDSGADEVVRDSASIIWGWCPVWLSDGKSLAFIDATYLATTVSVYTLGAASRRVLVTSPQLRLYDYLRRYTRPGCGVDGVLFMEIGVHPAPAHLMRVPSGEALPWRLYLGAWDATSPDGREAVLVRAQAEDSVGVLFLRSVDDLRGITRRQLTFWNP